MNVILKQDVEKLGKVGDVVKVAPGYGRNYLIPKKLALEATPGNIKVAETEKVAQARRDHREKEAATILAREIVKLTVTIRCKTGEGGALYGSVTALDIADFLDHAQDRLSTSARSSWKNRSKRSGNTRCRFVCTAT